MKNISAVSSYPNFSVPDFSTKMTIKDPGSAITHFIGLILTALGASPLMIRAGRHPEPVYSLSMAVFLSGMILLYSASTAYHTFEATPRISKILKKIDHMMISILIAASYTPVCLIILKGRLGMILLAVIWGLALGGIAIKALWVFCPKWFSSILYIGMGWTCLLAIRPLLASLSFGAFLWLLAGGILYTVGGVVYALKFPGFDRRHPYFGVHEIFHLFVMGGSFCHYIFMFFYVL